MAHDEQVLASLEAMHQQEQEAYKKRDYLGLHPSLDRDCRVKMVDWCLQVVDFCKFSGNLVEITMNYMDRYLQRQYNVDRRTFLLVSMTALYVAVKAMEPVAVDSGTISSLSGGLFTKQDIEEMELILLSKLNWRMNPPCSMDFVRQYLELLDLPQDQAQHVLDTTQVQIHSATRDYDLSVKSPASRLGFCALANSLLLTNDHHDGELQQLARICGIQLQPNCSIQYTLQDKLVMRPLYDITTKTNNTPTHLEKQQRAPGHRRTPSDSSVDRRGRQSSPRGVTR